MQPAAELGEARERPSADAEAYETIARHRAWQRMERDHDPVIEFGFLGPDERETGALPIDDERGRKLHVNLCLHPDLRRPKAAQVAGGVSGPTDGERRHARGTVRRNDDRERSIDGQEDGVELSHGSG